MKKIILLLLATYPSLHSQQRYLIIHGTWTKPFSWHMPGGDFYDALANAAPTSDISFFLWSGKNKHEARKEAALKLVNYIETFFDPSDELNIISHSHGSNVVTLATQIMANKPCFKHRIKRFFALGTPVCPKEYAPDMLVIEYMYNMFSFNDFIQPVFSFFKREYPPHERIVNIDITIDGKEPMHTQLHHPVVARWLPHISAINVDFSRPACMQFFSDKAPIYTIDTKRTAKIERDLMIQMRVNNIVRGRNISLDKLPVFA